MSPRRSRRPYQRLSTRSRKFHVLQSGLQIDLACNKRLKQPWRLRERTPKFREVSCDAVRHMLPETFVSFNGGPWLFAKDNVSLSKAFGRIQYAVALLRRCLLVHKVLQPQELHVARTSHQPQIWYLRLVSQCLDFRHKI